MYYNIFFLLLFLAAPAFGQVQDEDLIYYYPHQQNEYVYDAKFLDDDSQFIISGDKATIFFDTETGAEIKRIEGGGIAFMIENDTKILKHNLENHTFYIYDYETLEIVDSLETDGRNVDNAWPYPVLTNDKRYLVVSVFDGIRVWDIETRKILATSKYEFELLPDIIEWSIFDLKADCENNVYMIVTKRLLNLVPPYDLKWVECTYKLDMFTLDTLGQLPFRGKLNFSNDCSLVLYSKNIEDPDNMRIDYFPSLENKVYREGSNRNINDVEFFNDNQNVLVGGSHFLNIIDTENGGSLVYYYGTGTIFHVAISNNEKYVLCSGATSVVLLHCRLNPNAIEEKQQDNIKYQETENEIIIYLDKNYPEITAKLINLEGKVINSEIYPPGINEIHYDISRLTTGVYILSIYSDDLIKNIKFIKK